MNGMYSTFISQLISVFNCFIYTCLLLPTSPSCNSGFTKRTFFPLQRILGTDPKENVSRFLLEGRCLMPLFKIKSKSHYDWRPVGQCVLVSSPVWGSWPDVSYFLTVTVLSISGAHSYERSGLSFVLVTWTASVQYSKFAAGPRQHSISPYL
jgi:hypothetical protein